MNSLGFFKFICACAIWFTGSRGSFAPSYSPTLIPPPNQPPPSSACPSKRGSFRIDNKCILVENSQLSWTESTRFCQQLGYRLLEITSGELYFQIITNLRSRGILFYSYWIGAAKAKTGQWCWRTRCEPIHPTFWAVTIINGKPVKEPIGDRFKNCALLDRGRSHFINTDACNVRHPFICEKDLQPSVPSQPTHPTQPGYPPTGDYPFPKVAILFFADDEGEESPCPPDWTYWAEGGECFYFETKSSYNFQDAESACHAVDGYLVQIESSAESDFISEELEQLSEETDNSCSWIGVYSGKHGFMLKHGDLKIENWGPGEPSIPASSNPCVCAGDNGYWSTKMCSASYGYICEKHIPT